MAGAQRGTRAEPLGSDLAVALAVAAVLAVLDGLAVLFLAGRLTRRAAAAAALMLTFALVGLDLDPARAQAPAPAPAQAADMERALAGTTQTQLAYVTTGDAGSTRPAGPGSKGSPCTCPTARAGARRTGARDVATDELAFYALIYWPISGDQPVPSAETMAKVDTFLKNGGSIIFDTRDAGGFTPSGFGADTAENRKLREILAFVDVPPLEPVPPDHVLTKAFYLLSDSRPRGTIRTLGREPVRQPTDRERRRAAATADSSRLSVCRG
jgi:hypothetical protein